MSNVIRRAFLMLAMIVCFSATPLLMGQKGERVVQYIGGKWVEIATSARADAMNASGQTVGTHSVAFVCNPTVDDQNTTADDPKTFFLDLAFSDTNITSGYVPCSELNPLWTASTISQSWTRGRGINSTGQVVGMWSPLGGTDGNRNALFAHAFLYSGGTFSDLGTLGGPVSEALAISDAGIVVGWSTTGAYTLGVGTQPIRHAFSYTGGTMSDLGTLGGSNSIAYAVNSTAGFIAGISDTASNAARHLFKYVGGVMTDLGTPSWGDVQFVGGISNTGVIVGCAGSQGFFFDGVFHQVPFLNGDTANCPTSINPANGDIVGFRNPSNHPFLYSGGSFTDLGLTGTTIDGQSITWPMVIPVGVSASTIIGIVPF